jgi:hypothetical protein
MARVMTCISGILSMVFVGATIIGGWYFFLYKRPSGHVDDILEFDILRHDMLAVRIAILIGGFVCSGISVSMYLRYREATQKLSHGGHFGQVLGGTGNAG